MLKLPNHLSEVFGRGGTVVVPSRQRAHALRLAYAAAQLTQGRRVWASPDALPLEGWLTREVERYAAESANSLAGGSAGRDGAALGSGGRRGVPRLLAPTEEWLLWRQCTAEATGGLELLNRAALAESLRRASSLAADLDIDLRAIREPPGTEGGLLVAVHRAVEARCETLGAALLPTAVSALPCVGDDRPVVFAGFLAPSPRLQAIAAARAQQGCETLYPPATTVAELAPPRVVRPASEPEELERIAEWCRERLSNQADGRLLVVLPGSAGRRERLATLIRQAVDPRGCLARGAETESESLVIIEGGQPLASLPAVSHALASLTLLAGGALEIESLAEWLRAPWWAEPDPPSRARLDLWLRERGRLQFDLTSLSAMLRRAPAALAEPARVIATRLERAGRSLHESAGTPREWSERFRAALDVLGWPGARARSSAEQQTLVRFHELLDELGQLSAAARTLRRDLAVQWLTELATRTAYRPADDDAAVTISSTYADPVVRYDAIWVAGLNAEALPQPVAPDPFLPLPAQIAAGWPAASAAGRLEEARALVTAWRAAAAELALSAPVRAEDIELLPSPLLEEWRPVQPPAESRASIWLPVRLHRPGLLTEWRDDVGATWDPQLPLPSGTRSLELQNQCPFRAYAELRLGSVKLGVPEPGIAPDARGQLLHAALQKLWERLGDSRALRGLSPEALDEWVATCVEDAAATLDGAPEEDSIAQATLARECRRTGRLVRKLLDIERRRPPFRVQQTEYSSRLHLAGQELRLRIDRLDALESGGLAILDYKSGRRVSPDWYGDRPSHPQLLAYLAAVGEDVVAMATVNVTAREIRFDGVAASEELLPKVAGVKAPKGESRDPWQSWVREWRGLVERLAIAFAAGHAAVDPKPRACDFCHVASVCRVGDGLRDDESPEEDAPGMDDE